jgi:uncharacterized membrane protein
MGQGQNALANLSGQVGGEDIQYTPGLKTKTLGLDHNLAGLLAFVTPLWLVWILAEDKTPQNRWLRFMAFQMCFLVAAYSAVSVVVSILGSILGGIIAIFAVLLNLVLGLAGLGFFVVLVLTGLKANKGETPRLPVVSKFAAKYA